MAFLEQFSEDQRNRLVSIPYRAGVWVSMADDDGGVSADAKELEALEKIIDKKASSMFESAFVHEVMVETCTRRNDWKDWAKNPDTVLGECEEIITLLSEKLAERDVNAYRQNVMYVAVEVAKAFREFDIKAPFWTRAWATARMCLDKLVGFVRKEAYESESLLNISYAEDIALSKLSQSLGIGIKNQALE